VKITKSQIIEIIREELEQVQKEGYMDAYDRAHEDEERERRRQMRRIEAERERNQRSGRTGVGTRMGGSYKKERFAGFNRDDESADHREDHNIDDLYAMVRNLKRELDDMKGKK
jgi:hypothetical protein